MLNFDLNQNPPTAEEIAAEEKRTTRIFCCAMAIIILSLIGLRWTGFTMMPRNAGVLLGWFMDGDYALHVGAVVAVFYTFAHLRGFGLLSSTLWVGLFPAALFGVESLLLAPRMWMDLSAAGDSGGAALVSALVLALIVSVLVAGWGMDRNDRLDDVAPSDCDRLIADCLADPLCEAYRQKVAVLGRKLVKAEATMIRGRGAGVDAHEQERREGIACALVASKEPLPSDADAVLKGEISC